ncbi:Uma2 family endonuclease [Nonomuraea sp. NN258]|uniref:Uma2 family endonuclease n=1 Tax=Nonomuraea antri TaxID=2730852 RepID=UPI001567E05C|nr:Uma2 family endonuclease [Nonomuraea antri]NRQ35335.1 Uma2 family endonuclease [Nonomuraea antri]
MTTTTTAPAHLRAVPGGRLPRTARELFDALPDLVLAPPGCPRRAGRELMASGLIMAAEVVDEDSTHQDRRDKPAVYAQGGVPILLVVDPIATPATLTLYRHPDGGAYRVVTTVAVGEPLALPGPVGVTLDTSAIVKD